MFLLLFNGVFGVASAVESDGDSVSQEVLVLSETTRDEVTVEEDSMVMESESSGGESFEATVEGDSMVMEVTASGETYKPVSFQALQPEAEVKADGYYETGLYTGAATYTYGLAVMPGTGGLQPSLTLSYSSHNALDDGWVGGGWSLGENYIARDVNGTLDDEGDDELELYLNGRRYDLVYVPFDGRYHTQPESYLHIQKHSGAPNDGGEYWIVRDTGGVEYRFGYGGDSELVRDIPGKPIQKSYGRTVDFVGDGCGSEYWDAGDGNWITQASIGNMYCDPGYPTSICDYNVYSVNQHKVRMEVCAMARPGYSCGGGCSAQAHFTFQYNEPNNATDPTVVRWSLDRVEDTHDNHVYYSYVEDGGVAYLDEIEYNNDRTRVIDFTLEDDPNPLLKYVNGAPVERGKRLQKITETAAGSLVRSYTFNYTENSIETVTLLTGIQLCGGDDTTCLPETVFEYNMPEKGWSSSGVGLPCNFEPSSGCRFANLNGDALTDVVQANSEYRRSWLNNGSKWVEDSRWAPPSDVSFTSGFGWGVVDLNGDGRADLVSSAGSYLNDNPGWETTNNWDGVCDFKADSACNFVDLNGDGLPDVISTKNGRHAWLNTGAGFAQDDSWAPDLGVTLGSDSWGVVDLNGDGNVDLLGTTQEVVNTGLYYTWLGEDAEWENPCDFTAYGGCRYADLNADGLTDILKSTDAEHHAWLNNGSGWMQDDTWATTESFTEPKVTVTDLNGDGLPDISYGVKYKNGYAPYRLKKVRNGLGGAVDVAYNTVEEFGDLSWMTADWHTPASVVEYTCDDPSYPVENSIDGSTSTEWRESDGDCTFQGENYGGYHIIMDLGQAYNVREVSMYSHRWYNNAPYTLYSKVCSDSACNNVVGVCGVNFIDKGTGWHGCTIDGWAWGRYVHAYGASPDPDYPAEGIMEFRVKATEQQQQPTSNNEISYPMWLVKSVARDNGMSGAHSTVDTIVYNYSGGMHDYEDDEFRGFRNVTVHRPDQSMVSTMFHQDDARKGQVNTEYTLDKDSSKVVGYENTISTAEVDGIYRPLLLRTDEYTYDGSDTPKVSAVEYDYDSYGNTVETHYLGDASAQGDELYERADYLYNTGAWIVDRPKLAQTLRADGVTPVAKTYFIYDGLGYGTAPVKGDLTEREGWLNTGENPVTVYGYDAYGNQVNVTDPLGHVTEQIYGLSDATYTYPEETVNALGHVTSYTYDFGTGNVLSAEDANGYVTSFEYDALGRKVKEIHPYDSSVSPTVEYTHVLDGVAPEYVEVSRKTGSDPLEYVEFYDGLGRLIQAKRDSEDSNQQIATNLYYDEAGRVGEQSIPYLTVKEDGYSTPSAVLSTVVGYDAAGRVVNVTNTDGTVRRQVFDQWTITAYDENSHRRDYVLDAYGRVKTVREYNLISSDPPVYELYTTVYGYDLLDNLVSITDDQGNVFDFTYDSLGRKTRLDDPDLGVWTYEYDAVGNLIEQTDNRGVPVGFTYDELNRVQQKTYVDGTVDYTYDAVKGTLSSIQDQLGTTSFGYDERLRKTGETRTVGDSSWTMEWTYDPADRVLTQTLPDETTHYYTYNLQGELETIDSVLEDIDYNALNKVTLKDYGEVETSLLYDDTTFRLSQILSPGLQDLSYGYDSVGNVQTIEDVIVGNVQEFGYDSLDRLVEAVEDGSLLVNLTYDSLGNILSVGNTSDTLQYGYGVRPHAVTYLSPGGGASGDLCSGSHPPGDGTWTVDEETSCSSGNIVVTGDLEFLPSETLDLNSIVLDVGGELVFDYDNTLAMDSSDVYLASSTESGGPSEETTTTTLPPTTSTTASTTTTSTTTTTLPDLDGDGFVAGVDCDDTNPLIYPGAVEVCNGVDDDCDSDVDEGLTFDADSDGYTTLDSCEGTRDDCDDGDGDVNPGGDEVCDGVDNDCDGQVDEGDVCIQYLDFSGMTFMSYDSQDINPTQYEILDGGATLHLWGNNWKAIPLPVDVVADTTVSFEFMSAGSQGEINGLGLDEDLTLSPDRIFQVYGTQAWGIRDYVGYAGGWKQYEIPVGQFYQGGMQYLVFANDADAGQATDVYFTNVAVKTTCTPGYRCRDEHYLGFVDAECVWSDLTYCDIGCGDGQCIELPPMQQGSLVMSNPLSYGGSQDQDSMNYELLNGGTVMHLWGNNWKAFNLPVDVDSGTTLSFYFLSAGEEAEVNGVGFDNNLGLSSNTHFKVYGTQAWGIRTYDNYPGSGWTYYEIPVGQHYTGHMNYLTLSNDADANQDTDVYYANIRVT